MPNPKARENYKTISTNLYLSHLEKLEELGRHLGTSTRTATLRWILDKTLDAFLEEFREKEQKFLEIAEVEK